MTTITAKVIADSVSNPGGQRITTMQLRYPRFVHAEFMTHRQFSRNASSSRAVPVDRLIADILQDPAMPLFWGKNQKGMQAGEEIDTLVTTRVLTQDGGGRFNGLKDIAVGKEDAWLDAMNHAIFAARSFNEAGYHKQIVNRLLEPFSHINVVVTSTEWSNFFALRLHKDAEPHIRMLAEAMFAARESSVPKPVGLGEAHAPYADEVTGENKIKASVARCARVSYLTHDGKEPKLEDDLALFDKLVGSVPLHASPAEHQATPDPKHTHREFWGNFQGWVQYRKTLPGECQ